MKQIKPEVFGYKRVFNDGELGFAIIPEITKSKILSAHDNKLICIHSNGKPKFRPVYKKESL